MLSAGTSESRALVMIDDIGDIELLVSRYGIPRRAFDCAKFIIVLKDQARWLECLFNKIYYESGLPRQCYESPPPIRLFRPLLIFESPLRHLEAKLRSLTRAEMHLCSPQLVFCDEKQVKTGCTRQRHGDLATNPP